MNKHRVIYASLASAITVSLVLAVLMLQKHSPDNASNVTEPDAERELKAKQAPHEWFYVQRAFPQAQVDSDKRRAVATEFRQRRSDAKVATKASGEAVLQWQVAGPTNVPGRITDLAVHPTDSATIYTASAGAGLFKTTNLGQTWTPVFDEIGTYSMGAVALDPNNPETIYAGTGEINGRVQTYDGTGLYKSIDGGASWSFSGLPQSYGIGRILVDPNNSNIIFAAVMGRLWSPNPERGIYRSSDGGATWQQMLYLSDYTGAADLAIHPSTGTLFATMWERTWATSQSYTSSGAMTGPESALYRSTDGGDTWQLLDDPSLPTGATVGRIGITVDPSSQRVYAYYWCYPGDCTSVLRSDDLGNTWTMTNQGTAEEAVGTRGYYFAQIRVTPGQPDRVYILGIPMYRSDDGGYSWTEVGGNEMHVDHHAMYISPTTATFVIAGGDGGVFTSSIGGQEWTPLVNFPNTQFYAVCIDPNNPDRLYGGAQDNGTLRTSSGGLNDWTRVFGGDGFQVQVDPTNSNIIYAEAQWGYFVKSTNGGTSFYMAINGIDQSDRFNWNTPFVISPSDHETLYFGSQRLWRTNNSAASWVPMSDDLTDGAAAPGFNVITTIGVTPATNLAIYVGTDDGNVQVTQDGGFSWANRSAGLPHRWVTRVTVSATDPSVAYVTLSGYQVGERVPHIFRTDDYGVTWTDASGDLPDAPVNDLIVDPDDASTLYIATDFGVYLSTNMGSSWLPLGQGMPMQPVLDLDFHQPTRQIVAATHGRSMYRLYLSCASASDSDADGLADDCDNCPQVANGEQTDRDYDGLGDLCDACPDDATNDVDADGLCAVEDNCPSVSNLDQADADGDGIGDACDECTDTDGDFVGDPGYPTNTCPEDNCPDVPNTYGQYDDADGDGVGDACDICPGHDDNIDTDGNGIPDGCDGCCQGRVGDANNSHTDEPTIGDVAAIVDMLFISRTEVSCLAEADVNQSGGAQPAADEITIGDVAVLIDYLFITGATLGMPNCS